MVYPEQRLKLWLDEVKLNFRDKQKLEIIKQRMIGDLFTDKDELVGKEQGEFNQKFSRDMAPYINKYFGKEFSKLHLMDEPLIKTNCKEFLSKAEKYVMLKSFDKQGAYHSKLSEHSGWLSQYDINGFRKNNHRLELPG